LRMAAIELASTEGFTRSAADVSLRRLAHYSLSPVMKNAFEQVYGAPFLARLVFGEIGATAEEDLFLRVEYDGAIATNGGGVTPVRDKFAVLSSTAATREMMEKFLRDVHKIDIELRDAVRVALDAWSVGHLGTSGSNGEKQVPDANAIAKHRDEQLATAGIEAAVLERNGSAIRYRALSDEEARSLLA
jgi:proteasome alpha subunit